MVRATAGAAAASSWAGAARAAQSKAVEAHGPSPAIHRKTAADCAHDQYEQNPSVPDHREQRWRTVFLSCGAGSGKDSIDKSTQLSESRAERDEP